MALSPTAATAAPCRSTVTLDSEGPRWYPHLQTAHCHGTVEMSLGLHLREVWLQVPVHGWQDHQQHPQNLCTQLCQCHSNGLQVHQIMSSGKASPTVCLPYPPVLHTVRFDVDWCGGGDCLIIIIIFINCNWVVTQWQWLFYMYTKYEIGLQSMKLVSKIWNWLTKYEVG